MRDAILVTIDAKTPLKHARVEVVGADDAERATKIVLDLNGLWGAGDCKVSATRVEDHDDENSVVEVYEDGSVELVYEGVKKVPELPEHKQPKSDES